MRFKLIYILLISTLLISCGGTTHHLASGNFSENQSYRINSYYGCCGCHAKYFLLKTGKQETAQIIYSYNCYTIGKPTKFIFNHNKKGQIISCEKYIATTDSDFTIQITDAERHLFNLADTSITLRDISRIINLSAITGFRKPTSSETTHDFPLIKKGHKLPIQ